MSEAKPSALELRQNPESSEAANAIHLPAEMPPPPEAPPADLEPAPTVEQLTKNELRLLEEADKTAPVPERLLESVPMVKPSLVVPVEVNAHLFQDFLDSLTHLTRRGDVPIMRNVRMSYTEGELQLEATDGRVWGRVRLKAQGGRDGFECVLPLQRARNVIRRILSRYATLSIGVDQANIHLGNYSFPHGGSLRDYPARPTLMPDQLKVALPACYISSILQRVGPAVDPDHDRPVLRGIHLDFSDGLAVATDGHRLHLLALPEMKMATRSPHQTPPSVTLTPEVFRFLAAVVERNWVGLLVHPQLVTAVGTDFGVLAQPLEEGFVHWRKVLPDHDGFWVVDKEALLEGLRDAQPLGATEAVLTVDTIGERLVVRLRGHEDAACETTITAQRRGGAPALRVTLNPRYLLDAVDATAGGLVRLGFSPDGAEPSPVTVRGADDEFVAVIMPIAE
jgi:DNA polymerase III sliding clamp (beta) subunit (PCNA family)